MKNELRVFQVVPAAAWGGGSVVILRLIRALVRAGCRVTVLCATDPRTVAEFSHSGAEVVHARHWRRPISPLRDLLFLLELYRLCRQEKFDVVHTHMPKGGVIGRVAARIAGTPLVIHTIHGLTFNESMSRSRAWLYRTLERLTARCCDLFISVNAQDRQRAIAAGIVPPDRVVTVLNGIDVEPFLTAQPAPLRTELGLPADALLIGATGRLATQKGFEFLIRAAPAIVAAEPRAHIVLVGGGELEADLRALVAELDVQDRCHLLGFRQDVPELLAAFDLYAQPSLWEGLSISLLEAMAAGKPIVTTDIIGNREVVQDGLTGLLVPPAHTAALAQAVQRLLDDPVLAERLGQHAQQHALKCFSADRMIHETLDLYRVWLAKTSARAAALAMEF